ncbi:MAG: TIGR03905 family TSCPD domain-containing protein [Oscillospiraceae bacterium]|nr:TIGR03905 family TSCPD domain-containing protein [Oscillospiraceae bacterium]
MHFEYKTEGVCSRVINFDIEDGVIRNVEFTGGCNGNLKAISTLVDGMTVEEIEKKLRGIHCGHRQTSCSDQLARAVMSATEAK